MFFFFGARGAPGRFADSSPPFRTGEFLASFAEANQTFLEAVDTAKDFKSSFEEADAELVRNERNLKRKASRAQKRIAGALSSADDRDFGAPRCVARAVSPLLGQLPKRTLYDVIALARTTAIAPLGAGIQTIEKLQTIQKQFKNN